MNVISCTINTRAKQIIAASSVLKADNMAIAKANAMSDTLKAFSPALAEFQMGISFLFCLIKPRTGRN
jgi:hypothetical protein